MAELPQNWIKTTFTQIFDIQGGTQPPKSSFIYEERENYIRLLQIRDFGNKPMPTYIPFKSNLKLCSHDDVLIARYGASIGRILTGMDGAYNVAIAKVIIPDSVEKRFVYYLLNSSMFQRPILSIERSAQDGFNKDDLSKIELKIPPLNEQKRIVEKLDKMMRIVEEVNARLDKIPTVLKRARQSILNQAITGELTKDWREKRVKPLTVFSQEDINEAKMAYYMQLCEYAKKNNLSKPKFPKETKISDKKISDLPEIPNTWKYYRLFDISNIITDGTHKTPKYVDSGIPFLSVKNVRPFKINDSDIKYITAEESKVINLRCNPEIGDILYTKVGATYGYAAQIDLDYDFSIFVSLALIKPVKQYFISSYAEIVLNSEIVFQQAREKISGIAVPDLHLIEIKDFRIPLPPLEEQTEIVRRVKLAFEKLDKIELRYQKAKEYSDKLTQSILNKAFRGELVPQDPNDKPVEIKKQI